jgi:hypothetical protein
MTIPLVPLLRSACAARRAAWLVAVVGGGLVFVGTRGLAQEAVSRIAPFPRPQVAGIEGYIQTQNGYFLSAVQGGGVGGPDSGKGLTALHTDASKASSWEFFTLVVLDATHFALKTADGHFVTAVNGGGIGSTPGAQQPIVTNASVPAGSELVFRIQHTPSGTVTIKTSSGRFLTAVNAGGFGGPNDTPIHTDATVLGPWEKFTWVPIVVTYHTGWCPVANSPGCSGGTKNSPTCVISNTLSFPPPQCTSSNPGAP